MDHVPSSADTAAGPAGAPRWVKAFTLAGVIVVLLLAVMLLAGGDHGPGRHGPGRHTQTSGATEYGG